MLDAVFIGGMHIAVGSEQGKVFHVPERAARFDLIKWAHGFHRKIVPIAIGLEGAAVIGIGGIRVYEVLDKRVRPVNIGGPAQRIVCAQFERPAVRGVVP